MRSDAIDFMYNSRHAWIESPIRLLILAFLRRDEPGWYAEMIRKRQDHCEHCRAISVGPASSLKLCIPNDV